MSPEFGSTCAIFPIDAETIRYLTFTGRPAEHGRARRGVCQGAGALDDEHAEDPTFTSTLALDLGSVEPSLAGPRRPQDRVPLRNAQEAYREELKGYVAEVDAQDEADSESFPASDPPAGQTPVSPEPADPHRRGPRVARPRRRASAQPCR